MCSLHLLDAFCSDSQWMFWLFCVCTYIAMRFCCSVMCALCCYNLCSWPGLAQLHVFHHTHFFVHGMLLIDCIRRFHRSLAQLLVHGIPLIDGLHFFWQDLCSELLVCWGVWQIPLLGCCSRMCIMHLKQMIQDCNLFYAPFAVRVQFVRSCFFCQAWACNWCGSSNSCRMPNVLLTACSMFFYVHPRVIVCSWHDCVALLLTHIHITFFYEKSCARIVRFVEVLSVKEYVLANVSSWLLFLFE